MSEAITLRSRDGLQWSVDPEGDWGLANWFPEPPLFGFYNRAARKHTMTVRPGWGDRRVALQTSSDCRRWSGPELLFEPDATDNELVEFYGMPVFPYGIGYVGLLWVFHSASSQPVGSFNRFVGSLDCQLTYSYDGIRFNRGLRQPFIQLTAPGEHGCGAIQPSCLVETDREIRIYSGSSKILHGMSRHTANARKRRLYAILMHTLRKDGFMYLQSGGDWGRLQTKPLMIRRGGLTMNVQAPLGEISVQICDLESRPIKGFTFEQCHPLREQDTLAWAPTWRQRRIGELNGQVLRLEVSLRNARLYSLRSDCHFLDAQDMWMLRDQKPIDASLFDY